MAAACIRLPREQMIDPALPNQWRMVNCRNQGKGRRMDCPENHLAETDIQNQGLGRADLPKQVQEVERQTGLQTLRTTSSGKGQEVGESHQHQGFTTLGNASCIWEDQHVVSVGGVRIVSYAYGHRRRGVDRRMAAKWKGSHPAVDL
ncbi:hypothetical protein NE237_026029 [Protea cynaroides]|uniref:Uncharacterized protein n=1 Tax=Protea cynaroides TaxID=273540 RepID=A0A9Q0H3G7_9MAGN|nr:hypothetical protein NE237_026029 [Protea cynaroides]